MHFFSARVFSLILVVLGLSAVLGCTAYPSNSARPAVDAFNSIIGILEGCSQKPDLCDETQIWDKIDAQSKMAFIQAYVSLVRMDKIITTYFDPIEHKQMRDRTGTDVLENQNIANEIDLFSYLFHPEKLVFDESTKSGLQFKNDDVKSDYVVVIHTNQAGQTFTMVQESDGQWRLRLGQAVLMNALTPIMESDAAMQEYAQSYFADEIDRRKRVRDYFNEQRELQKSQINAHRNP